MGRRFVVSEYTVTRFYVLHFLIPLALAILVLGHLHLLHVTGRSSLSYSPQKISFFPFLMMKDALVWSFYFIAFVTLVCVYSNSLRDAENFIHANSMVTPIHIKPEWYFLFAYAILRCIPDKTTRVLALAASVVLPVCGILGKGQSGLSSMGFFVYVFIWLTVFRGMPIILHYSFYICYFFFNNTFLRWFRSTNHKDIGSLYLLTGLSFRITGSSLSGMLRMELTGLGTSGMDRHAYNVVVTGHGIIMIFFFVMPMLIGGFRNWLIPFMMGVPDMAWPRLNNFSFWMLLPASMCLAWGLLQGRVRSGWTIYPPLSALETPMDAMIFSLHLARISSILGAINFLTTILMNGPKRFSMYNLYLYLYCMAVTVFMLLTTLPVLAAGITMILFDRHFNTSFFNVARRGDPILFQHFWFFGHPE